MFISQHYREPIVIPNGMESDRHLRVYNFCWLVMLFVLASDVIRDERELIGSGMSGYR